jgi:hypothetical protein
MRVMSLLQIGCGGKPARGETVATLAAAAVPGLTEA